MFIIECAVTWMLYNTEMEAKQDLEAYREYYESNYCKNPYFLTKEKYDFLSRVVPEDYRKDLGDAEERRAEKSKKQVIEDKEDKKVNDNTSKHCYSWFIKKENVYEMQRRCN